MRAVVTRVKSASVAVDGKTTGAIGQGLLILLGIAPEDTPAHCKNLADKILGLRIFRDDDDKMNRSLADVGGSVLVVSQFTLYGDCRNYDLTLCISSLGFEKAYQLLKDAAELM